MVDWAAAVESKGILLMTRFSQAFMAKNEEKIKKDTDSSTKAWSELLEYLDELFRGEILISRWHIPTYSMTWILSFPPKELI